MLMSARTKTCRAETGGCVSGYTSDQKKINSSSRSSAEIFCFVASSARSVHAQCCHECHSLPAKYAYVGLIAAMSDR